MSYLFQVDDSDQFVINRACLVTFNLFNMQVEKRETGLIPQHYKNWQGRPEWFFNREHTDTYEQWYEGRYKRAEVWQKKVMEQLVSKDKRVKTLLEFGCG